MVPIRPLTYAALATSLPMVITAGVFAEPYWRQRQSRMHSQALPAAATLDDVSNTALLKNLSQHGLLNKPVLNWFDCAAIVDHVAKYTASDDVFRRAVWQLFGFQTHGQPGLLAHRLNPNNGGLPQRFHNSHYSQEQIHHYLGAVTGNLHPLFPSHLMNNPVWARLYEIKEWLHTGHWNAGDVRLSDAARPHRNDFLRHGRKTVAANMRALLITSQQESMAAVTQTMTQALPATDAWQRAQQRAQWFAYG